MKPDERVAIDNAAIHLSSILNKAFSEFMLEPMTPEKLVYVLLLADDVPDGNQAESLGTVRGLMQRLYHLQRAVKGEPGKIWARYWVRGRNVSELDIG